MKRGFGASPVRPAGFPTLPAGSPPARVEDKPPRPAHVGIAIPAQVSYVAKVLAAPPYRDPLSAPLFVLAKQLSNGYLYRHIRVQGGAYGGSCRYEPLSGLFAFLSYRDPHLDGNPGRLPRCRG